LRLASKKRLFTGHLPENLTLLGPKMMDTWHTSHVPAHNSF
jgi:hypothetical protein